MYIYIYIANRNLFRMLDLKWIFFRDKKANDTIHGIYINSILL